MSSLSDLVKYITITKQELIKLEIPGFGSAGDSDDDFNKPDFGITQPPARVNSPIPDEYKVYVDSEGFVTGTQKTPMDLGIQPYEGPQGGQYVDKRLLQSNHPDEYDNMHKRNPDLPPAYGGIVIDDDGKILMRKVTNDFDGMTWSLAKGKQDKDDEDELATATREVGEEMGIDVEIAGEIPGWYNTDNSTSKYFLMRMTKDNNKPDEPAHDWETEKIEWVDLQEALKRLNGNKNTKASERDRDALLAAMHVTQSSKEEPSEPDEAAKPKPTTDSVINDLLDDILAGVAEDNKANKVPITVHISELSKEFAKNGTFPSDLATNPKYTRLRNILFASASSMETSDGVPSQYGGPKIDQEAMRDIRGRLVEARNDTLGGRSLYESVDPHKKGLMGSILHEIDKTFGDKKITESGTSYNSFYDERQVGDIKYRYPNYNFKNFWTSFYNGGVKSDAVVTGTSLDDKMYTKGWYDNAAGSNPEANILQDVVGQLMNTPHNFRFGVKIPDDVDNLGNIRHMTDEKRNEMIETFEAWRDGDIDADGEFSWGEKFNFDDETPVYINASSIDGPAEITRERVNGWEHSYNVAVEAREARKNGRKESLYRNVLRRYGRNYLKSQGTHPEDVNPSLVNSEDRGGSVYLNQGDGDKFDELWQHEDLEPLVENYSDVGRAEYEAGLEMAKKFVQHMNTSQSQLLQAAFGPGVNGQMQWRQTASPTEVGGDVMLKDRDGNIKIPTDRDTQQMLSRTLLHEKLGAYEENEPGTAVHVHSTPISGSSHKPFGYNGGFEDDSNGTYMIGTWKNFSDVLSHTIFSPNPKRKHSFESEKESLYMHNPNDISYVAAVRRPGEYANEPGWKMSDYDILEGSVIPKNFTKLPTEQHGFTNPDRDYSKQLVPVTQEDNEALGSKESIHSHNKDGQFGSNRAVTVKDPKTNKIYYVKTEDPAKNKAEILSNRLYELAGIAVPNTELVKYKGSASTKSEWLPNAGEVSDWDHPDITNGFLVDVMLNNWDVIGMNNDNVISSEGKVYRVDNGGSLHFSSAGGNTKMKGFHKSEWYKPSGSDFTSANPEGFTEEDFPYLPTIAAMQNPAYPAGKVFGNMSTEQYKGAAKALLNLSNGKIKRLVNESAVAADDRKGYEADKMVQTLIDRRDSIIDWLINEKKGVLDEGKSLSDIHDQHNLLKTEFLFKEDDDRTEEFRLPHIYMKESGSQQEGVRDTKKRLKK